jgi:hypothetical protein
VHQISTSEAFTVVAAAILLVLFFRKRLDRKPAGWLIFACFGIGLQGQRGEPNILLAIELAVALWLTGIAAWVFHNEALRSGVSKAGRAVVSKVRRTPSAEAEQLGTLITEKPAPAKAATTTVGTMATGARPATQPAPPAPAQNTAPRSPAAPATNPVAPRADATVCTLATYYDQGIADRKAASMKCPTGMEAERYRCPTCSCLHIRLVPVGTATAG